MLKLNHCLFYLLFALPLLSHGQSLNKSRQVAMANGLMEKYHPDAMSMLQRVSNLPTQFQIGNFTYRSSPQTNPSTWLDGKSEMDLIGSMNTIIHESHHAFTSSYYLKMLAETPPNDFDGNSTYRSFSLSDTETILVRVDAHYNSNELKSDIPKSLRTFRYNPYIAPKDRYLSSQVSGIYGLLNEFNAYYQGALMTMQMYPEYLDRAKKDFKVLQAFVQHIGHSYGAFFEFKYFCLLYLKRAEERHPEAFAESMKNEALREVYTKVHNRYEALIKTFDNILLKTVEDLNNNGITSEIRDGYFWIGGYGVGIMNEDVEKLSKALDDSRLEILHNNFLLNN